jgi:hypothetical protein
MARNVHILKEIKYHIINGLSCGISLFNHCEQAKSILVAGINCCETRLEFVFVLVMESLEKYYFVLIFGYRKY